MTTMNVPTIPPEIEARRDEIEALCRRFGVVRLDLFGSAPMGRYDPFTSDDAFLAIFPPNFDSGPWYGRFRDLGQELGWLMREKVDLVSLDHGRSPAVPSGIERSRVTMYR